MVNIFDVCSNAVQSVASLVVDAFGLFFNSTVAEVLSIEGWASSLPPFWASVANGTLFNLVLGVGLPFVIGGWVFKWFKEFIL